MARRLAKAGFHARTFAKETSDPHTTRLIEQMRSSGGVHTLWRGSPNALREMLRALKSGEPLGLLIDQDTKVQGVFVDFFGKKAWTPRAAADLALRFGTAIVTGFCFHRPDGGHRIQLARLIPPQPTGDRDADCVALTQAMTAAIEQAIRQAPDAWVWLHRRWKTRPPEEAAAPAEAEQKCPLATAG